MTFSDETEETLRVIFTQPDFTEHTKPQAGFIAKTDGHHFLVSVNLKEISPLKQLKYGVSTDEIQCKDNLVLIQRYDDSPACVTESTKQELAERGWSGTNLTETKNDFKNDATIQMAVDAVDEFYFFRLMR